MVGAGIKNVKKSAMPMSEVLPKGCVRYRQRIHGFDPDNNTVTLLDGQKVEIMGM